MSEVVPQPPRFPEDVDVAVVSHNGLATLPRVLDCLQAAGAPRDRIRVYDVASTDGTSDWLASTWPDVVVERLAENAGPNPARNRAMQQAARPFLLLLDPDAFVRPDAPARLRSAFEPDAAIGMVAPVIVHERAPDTIQYASGAIHFLCEAVSPFVDRPLAERGDERRDIGAAPGMGMLVDVVVARRLGGWDERYFMGKDDGEFCHRLRIAGYRLVEEPRAIVEHRSRPRSAWLFKFQIRNRWHLMLRTYERRTLIVLAPALILHEALQLATLVVKGHGRDWWAAAGEMRAWASTLGRERLDVSRTRRARDRDLLCAAPLLVRGDLVRHPVSRLLKRAYDMWLSAYWAVARRLLS